MTIWDDINDGKYTTTLTLPSTHAILKQIESIEKAIVDVKKSVGDGDSFSVIKDTLDNEILLLRDKLSALEDLRCKYYADVSRLNVKFKEDMEHEFGTEKFIGKDAMFEYASKEGHSGGLYEVANIYSGLVDSFSTHIRQSAALVDVATHIAMFGPTHGNNCVLCGADLGSRSHETGCIVPRARAAVNPMLYRG